MTAVVLRGDAAHLPLPDNCVDAVVTDSPYGLEFMGREWDTFKPSSARIRKRVDGRTNPAEGKSVTVTPEAYVAGLPFQRWCQAWAAECLRVLKPGGHLLAFGGTRTWHRLVCGIEDAGFEVRDAVADLTGYDAPGLMWVYGSGFPKSLDVSKAIDKAGGNPLAFREFARAYAAAVAASGLTHADIDRHLGIKASSCFWSREDHRGGMPPRHHWVKVRDLLALPAELEAIYDAAEREVIATGYRIRRESTVQIVGLSDGEYDITAPATEDAARWEGWGTALKPGWEPIAVGRKPLGGTVAQNVLQHGTGALNIDGCRVDPGTPVPGGGGLLGGAASRHEGWRRDAHLSGEPTSPHNAGRWPPNVALGPAAAAELDRQSGNVKSAGMYAKGSRGVGPKEGPASIPIDGLTSATYADTGGASRFFPVFRYEAKADARERPRLPDGTAWPTVKPVDLMAWLIRLVTPPGGRVLDPFCGTGTTAEACTVEGFDCVLIDRDPQAVALSKIRLARMVQPALFSLDDAG